MCHRRASAAAAAAGCPYLRSTLYLICIHIAVYIHVIILYKPARSIVIYCTALHRGRRINRIKRIYILYHTPLRRRRFDFAPCSTPPPPPTTTIYPLFIMFMDTSAREGGVSPRCENENIELGIIYMYV